MEFEQCEIRAKNDPGFLSFPNWELVAEAVNPHGTYIVARTPRFSPYDQHNALTLNLFWHRYSLYELDAIPYHRDIFNALVDYLIRVGCEPLTESGVNWYSRKFRRPISLLDTMDERSRAIAMVTAIGELEEALVKSDDEVMRVVERRWEILQEPITMTGIQQAIQNEKSEALKMGLMRAQRFLQNAKKHDFSWALTEEHRISAALVDAMLALFGATPDTIRQVLLTHQQTLLNTYGILFIRWADRRQTQMDESAQPVEIVRRAWKERRLLVIQFLEEAHNRDINRVSRHCRLLHI
jgi:hypothetical protein